MKRVVLDTNVLISAFATPWGVCGQIYEAWQNGAFDLVVSEYILDEFARVAVDKLKFSRAAVVPVLQSFSRFGEFVDPIFILVDGLAENDLPVMGAALAGDADFIVTGDKELLLLKRYRRIEIIPPQKFLEILGL